MTLFIGGTIVNATGSQQAVLRTDGEHVLEVGDLEAAPGEQVVDCTGCLLLPGGIDSHTHLQLESMGTVTADDFFSGTRSMLAGGTTTTIDFATQFHGETPLQGLAHWHAKADGHAVGDYAFHMAFTEWQPEFADQLAEVVAQGVSSFKMYMAYRDTMMVDDDQIYTALKRTTALGCTVGFHCENGYLIDARVSEELAAGHTASYFHQRTRPAEFEREAVNRLGVIAETAGAPVYAVHLSTAGGLAEIEAARERGVRYAAETCPQYLMLDDTAYGPEPANGVALPADERTARKVVMSPPLRDRSNQEPLWQGLADGGIQFIGTDHCSFTIDEQKATSTDFTQVPNGAPGLELRLPLMFSEGVAKQRLTPERFVAVTSTNAARYFGLYPRKGILQPGSDADVVVLDPGTTWTVHHEALHDGCDYTPFEGMPVQGKVREVFLRGRQVVADGEPVDDLPAGTFVPCGRPELDVR